MCVPVSTTAVLEAVNLCCHVPESADDSSGSTMISAPYAEMQASAYNCCQLCPCNLKLECNRCQLCPCDLRSLHMAVKLCINMGRSSPSERLCGRGQGAGEPAGLGGVRRRRRRRRGTVAVGAALGAAAAAGRSAASRGSGAPRGGPRGLRRRRALRCDLHPCSRCGAGGRCRCGRLQRQRRRRGPQCLVRYGRWCRDAASLCCAADACVSRPAVRTAEAGRRQRRRWWRRGVAGAPSPPDPPAGEHAGRTCRTRPSRREPLRRGRRQQCCAGGRGSRGAG